MHIKSAIVCLPSNCMMNFGFQGYYDLVIESFPWKEIYHFIKCCQEKISNKPTSYDVTHQLELYVFKLMDLSNFGFHFEVMKRSFDLFQYFSQYVLFNLAYSIFTLSLAEIGVLIDISLPVSVNKKRCLIQLIFKT
jgi:hypothetical protein